MGYVNSLEGIVYPLEMMLNNLPSAPENLQQKDHENECLEYDRFLLGWPIFRCKLLVSGSVSCFKNAYQLVESSPKTILSLVCFRQICNCKWKMSCCVEFRRVALVFFYSQKKSKQPMILFLIFEGLAPPKTCNTSP